MQSLVWTEEDSVVHCCSVESEMVTVTASRDKAESIGASGPIVFFYIDENTGTSKLIYFFITFIVDW